MSEASDDGGGPDGLMASFHAYERALMADDLAELDRLFAPGPDTLRGDAAGLLTGHDAIRDFRSKRGGTPRRRIVDTRVRAIDGNNALIIAVTELERGGRGLQTQLWRRGPVGWQVTAAHVAIPPPAIDTLIWRVLGDPLVAPSAAGPLDGESVAVKDLFAVAGHRLGAGNPTWLAEAEPERETAWAVARLLGSGAQVRGIARTDEFAYSLAGTNAHYGTPPNPGAPYRISGGSSSGSASAVSLGHASIGLGTDTGGSIRVPAAYQGLFGIRTSHGAVSRAGLMPLAPSFDTVGWLTRGAELLRSVGDVLLPAAPRAAPTGLVLVQDLLDLADDDVAGAVAGFAPEAQPETMGAPLSKWAAAFRTVQAHEAWRVHGPRLEGRLDMLGPDVRSRFEFARSVTGHDAAAARITVDRARAEIVDHVADRMLVLPAAPTVAPRIGSDLDVVREKTIQLSCIAGLGGLPAVVVPLVTSGELPCGACLVAAPGRDRDLLDLAVQLAGRISR